MNRAICESEAAVNALGEKGRALNVISCDKCPVKSSGCYEEGPLNGKKKCVFAHGRRLRRGECD